MTKVYGHDLQCLSGYVGWSNTLVTCKRECLNQPGETMRGMGMLASEILIGGQAGRNWMCVCVTWTSMDKHGISF